MNGLHRASCLVISCSCLHVAPSRSRSLGSFSLDAMMESISGDIDDSPSLPCRSSGDDFEDKSSGIEDEDEDELSERRRAFEVLLDFVRRESLPNGVGLSISLFELPFLSFGSVMLQCVVFCV